MPSKIKILNLNWRQYLVIVVGVCASLVTNYIAYSLSLTPVFMSGGIANRSVTYGPGLEFAVIGCSVVLLYTIAGVFYTRRREKEWYQASGVEERLHKIFAIFALASCLFGFALLAADRAGLPLWILMIIAWIFSLSIVVPITILHDASHGCTEGLLGALYMGISWLLLVPALWAAGALLGMTVLLFVR
ncbi:MAG TPA: hypothetical protein PKD05_04420 [Candidatus Melainabacteria bacterium]|nr:hypothetical protein [Candidatus Melainabacteria bacterium]